MIITAATSYMALILTSKLLYTPSAPLHGSVKQEKNWENVLNRCVEETSLLVTSGGNPMSHAS